VYLKRGKSNYPKSGVFKNPDKPTGFFGLAKQASARSAICYNQIGNEYGNEHFNCLIKSYLQV